MSDGTDDTLPPPDELEGEAKREWARLAAELSATGRLAKTDRALLMVYVTVWAVHRAAATAVLAEGATTILPNRYPATTKEYDVMVKTAQQLRALLKEMGLTPASRPKTQTPDDQELDI